MSVTGKNVYRFDEDIKVSNKNNKELEINNFLWTISQKIPRQKRLL